MKTQKNAWLLLSVGLFLLSGCFETHFDFKTVVRRNGSVERESHIYGRGASLFKTPTGPNWKVKTWESKGEETFIPNTYYHSIAHGKFYPGQKINSDYQFDVEKLINNLGEGGKKRLETAGITPPFEERLFSRNQIKVAQIKGWMMSTTLYEETFEGSGIIPLLLQDLKAELKKERQTPTEVELKDSDLDLMARNQLESEILPRIQFSSRVILPGKIISSNAKRIENHTAVWIFSMKDFSKGYSTYTLRAVSRSLRLRGIALVSGIVGLILLFLILAVLGMGKQKKGKTQNSQPPKKSQEKKK